MPRKKGGQQLLEMSRKKAKAKVKAKVKAKAKVAKPEAKPRVEGKPLRLDQLLPQEDDFQDYQYPAPDARAWPVGGFESVPVSAPLPAPEAPSEWDFALNFEPPPIDPKQAQIDSLNAKLDSALGMMQQTARAFDQQRIKQQEDDMARQKILDAVPPFNPQGYGYDQATADQAQADVGGMYDPETGHWGSRDPRSGMMLKGIGHDTWPEAEARERSLGNEITQGEDGRYYSFPSGTDTAGEVPADSPGFGESAPLEPPAAEADKLGYLRYTYDLSPKEIVQRAAAGEELAPNDKLLMPISYANRKEMRDGLNAALTEKMPLPPIVFLEDESVFIKLAEKPELQKWIMSPDDIQAYNLGLVEWILEEVSKEEEKENK